MSQLIIGYCEQTDQVFLSKYFYLSREDKNGNLRNGYLSREVARHLKYYLCTMCTIVFLGGDGGGNVQTSVNNSGNNNRHNNKKRQQTVE